MNFPSIETVKRLRKRYPVGCRIALDEMEDSYTKIPIGSQATVTGVDDAGNIMCNWDCHSGLSIAYGADRCHPVASEDEIKESLDHLGKIRQTALHCPRCGAEPDGYEHQQQALSRYADIQICNACGIEEALGDFCGAAKPLSDWAIVKAGWVE